MTRQEPKFRFGRAGPSHELLLSRLVASGRRQAEWLHLGVAGDVGAFGINAVVGDLRTLSAKWRRACRRVIPLVSRQHGLGRRLDLVFWHLLRQGLVRRAV